MIEAFLGMPGAGKTYLMTRQGLKLQKKKRTVYANYPLKGAIRFEQISDVYEVRNAIILLDEAGLIAPSSGWKSIPFEVMAHWREHRHHGVSLFYTAQDLQDVAAPLRRVTQFINRVQKFGPIISWRCYGGTRYKDKYSGGFTVVDPSICAAYDTHADVARQSYL